MTEEYELIAIGAGPAGESATELAVFFGHRSAIIEKHRPGGTVTTTGGVPTKTLREAALYFTGYRDREVYGLKMEFAPELMLDTIRKRTWSVCETLQQVTAENIAGRGVDYIQGTARLGPNRTVLVQMPDGSERSLSTKVILIATGSRPVRPANIPFDIPGVCDTDTLLLRGWLPKDILIVGGGPVAVEFATICHALGTRVTMVDRSSRLLPVMDGEVSLRLSQQFEKSGLRILFDTTLATISGSEGRPTLASIAMEQGRAAICHAFGIPFEGVVDPTPVSAVYGMPEVAGAGITEEECRAKNIDYEVGRCEFDLIPRGAIAGRGGLLKLIFLKEDRRLIGVHCMGDIASEVVGIGQMAIRCRATLNTIANMSMNTPTYSYGYKYAAFDGLRRLSRTSQIGAGAASS